MLMCVCLYPIAGATPARDWLIDVRYLLYLMLLAWCTSLSMTSFDLLYIYWLVEMLYTMCMGNNISASQSELRMSNDIIKSNGS